MSFRPIDAWYLGKNMEEIYWTATTATIASGLTRLALTGNPATLNIGRQMLSFGARAHMNAIRGILGTTITRGGAATLGSTISLTASASALGYASGAVIGTGISQAIWGDEGARTALELYTSPTKFWDDAILGVGDNVSTIWSHYTS